MAIENATVGILHRAVKIINDYGIFKVIQGITSIAILLFVIVYIPIVTEQAAKNGSIAATQQIDNDKNVEHQRMLSYRNEIQSHVDNILQLTLEGLSADRAFVMEMHNGSNNINNIPFLKVSVTYGVVRKGVEDIDEEYQNISLSRFKFPSYLHEKRCFIGSIEELSKIDSKLAMKLKSDDVSYIAIITLLKGNKEWGYVGVLYNEGSNVIPKDKIMTEFTYVSQEITRLLCSQDKSGDGL